MQNFLVIDCCFAWHCCIAENCWFLEPFGFRPVYESGWYTFGFLLHEIHVALPQVQPSEVPVVQCLVSLWLCLRSYSWVEEIVQSEAFFTCTYLFLECVKTHLLRFGRISTFCLYSVLYVGVLLFDGRYCWRCERRVRQIWNGTECRDSSTNQRCRSSRCRKGM